MPDPIHLVIPPAVNSKLKDFLREKSSNGREAFACLLCGSHNSDNITRLLARHLVQPDDDCFRYRAGGGLELLPGFDNLFLKKAEEEQLIPVQIHTHPHNGQPNFSSIDDACERKRADAIDRELGLPMASCVFGKDAECGCGRLWQRTSDGNISPVPVKIVSLVHESLPPRPDFSDSRYDRQVRAFGSAFQGRLDAVRIGIVGLGGTGSIMAQSLSRLGARHFVLVDPDYVEMSNLNRLVGATIHDVKKKKSKIRIALRTIRRMHGKKSRVRLFQKALPNLKAAQVLSGCDILIAATDNHSSRLAVQEIGSAFLRPVINLGVGIEVDNQKIMNINGRVGVTLPGNTWCLYCGGHIDVEEAGKEQSDPEHLALMKRRGYIDNTPNPAVLWVNMQAAVNALALFHNLLMPYTQKNETVGADFFLDMLTGEQFHISHPHTNTSCVVCSPDGLRGIGDAYWDRGELPDFSF